MKHTYHCISACPRLHHTTSAACCCSKTRSGEKYTDPFKLGWRDLNGLYEDIRKVRSFWTCWEVMSVSESCEQTVRVFTWNLDSRVSSVPCLQSTKEVGGGVGTQCPSPPRARLLRSWGTENMDRQHLLTLSYPFPCSGHSQVLKTVPGCPKLGFLH